MKIRSCLICLLAALVIAAVSCTDRGGRVRSALAAADSLMMTAPEAALDTLYGIDSTSIRKLDRGGRALYTLLRTEAEYKCYLPVAEDTAVFEAADYYRRKGPEELLARALIMEGAVLSEQGDAEGAMLSYKEAEPILGRSGDLEQLGLLNTRIAELYQRNIFNTEEAIIRYRKALDCFEKAGIKKREMYIHLSLATAFMGASEDSVLSHLKRSYEMARTLNDRLCGISAFDIYSTLYNSYNDTLVVKVSERFFSEYGRTPQSSIETAQYNGIYCNVVSSYLNLGMAQEAERMAELIVPSSDVDSLSLYSILYDIASANNDIDGLKAYKTKWERLFEQILRNDYESYILEIEKRYDNEILSDRLKISRNRIIALSSILLLVFAASVIVYLIFRDRARKREIMLRDAISDLQSLRAEILVRQNEATELQSLIHENEAVVVNLKRQMETEAEELKNLRDTLICQMSSNRELLSLNGDLLAVTKDISDLYYLYGETSSLEWLGVQIKKVLGQRLPAMNTFARIDAMLESVYPGFMSQISSEYPWLTAEHKALISLMSCGFTTNAVSIIMNMDIKKLNEKKTRLARKMCISIRLSTYLNRRLSSYHKPV